MSFSSRIPDKVLENPTVSSFMSVLDALQDFKMGIIASSLRFNCISVLTNKKWLLKKLGDYNITDIPENYPIPVLIQYLLNADTVFRTRGSRIGVELYCSLLSLGKVTIEDEGFYKEPSFLLLDSTTQGFITDDNEKNIYKLCADNDDMKSSQTLKITIESPYFKYYPEEAKLIKAYLESTISRFLCFSPDKKVTFNYQGSDEFYFHELLNPYFI